MLTKEEAAYICAAEDGVDLHKYLSSEKVVSIRNLAQTFGNQSAIIETRRNFQAQIKNTPSKEKIFNFDKECLDIKDSLLPNKFVDEAKVMMRLYAKTYLFENSVRNIVRMVMKNKYGNAWWLNVEKNLQIKIENRKKQENQTPWIGKRGEDELCYSDVSDLKKMMEDNWISFSGLGDKISLFNFLDIIERIRNIIAHHNLVGKDDQDALNVFLKSWMKAVESSRANFEKMSS